MVLIFKDNVILIGVQLPTMGVMFGMCIGGGLAKNPSGGIKNFSTVKSRFNEWPRSAPFHSLNRELTLNRDF